MIKEKRILSYFIGWLFLGYIIFIIGTNNVYASTYTGSDYYARLYDNVNGILTGVDTTGPYNEGLYEGYIPYSANSSGGAWLISSPITLISNHTYTLTASIPNECGPLVLSSVNRIGVGTTINNAKSSYQNNSDVNEIYSNVIGGQNFLIQYAFTPTINSTYIVFPFATSVSCNSSRTILENIVISDLGLNGVTEQQITNSLNSQTNEINNSIQNSTDTIINNQNQNNEQLKDTINENFNSCRPSVNLFNYASTNFVDSGNISLSGTANDFTISATGGGIVRAYYLTDINFSTLYRYMSSNYVDNSILLAITNSNNYSSWSDYANDRTIINWNMNNNSQSLSNYQGKYLWVQLRGSVAQEYYSVNYKDLVFSKNIVSNYEAYGEEICSNKIDETNDKLDGIQGALTDSSAPNTSGLENSAGWLPAGPLDSILNLPLTMLNSLTNSLGKTCSPLNLTLPYVNKQIQIPCLSAIFAQITGVNGLWTWVGTIASVLILYNYLLNLYAWVDRVLTLRAEFDEAMGADMANWGRL